jgi:hypothetical protein
VALALEIQRPLAIVVIGGLSFHCADLVLLPVLYRRFGGHLLTTRSPRMNGLKEAQLVRLNSVFPPTLEDAVTDALMADPVLPGFTLLHAEGIPATSRASIREKVRGRVDRRVIWVLIEYEQLEQVLAHLRQRIASSDVRWWVESVLASGRLV